MTFLHLAAALPDEIAGLGVITAGELGRADDDLGLAVHLGDRRRRPGGALVPVLAPELLTGGLVEGKDRGAGLLVAHDDDRLPGQGGRTALAETHYGSQRGQGLAPLEVAVQVETVQTARAEADPDVLAVGHGRIVREGARRLVALMGHRLRGGLLPQDFAGRAVHADEVELVDGLGSPRAETFAAARGRRRLSRLSRRWIWPARCQSPSGGRSCLPQITGEE